MTTRQIFLIDDPNFMVAELQPKYLKALQRLFDKCADYAMIVDGEDVSPTAAQEIFQ